MRVPKKLAAILIVLILLGAAGIALHLRKPDARKELEARIARDTGAIEQKDLNTLMEGVAPNVTFKNLEGKVYDYKAIEENYRKSFDQFASLKVNSTLETLTQDGDKATIEISQTVSGRLRSKKNKTHKVVDTSRTRNVMLRTEQGWKVQSGEVLSRTVTVDGKPFALPH